MSRPVSLDVIPGPRAPKQPETFLDPFEIESVQLAKGVSNFDCVVQQYFQLHIYNHFPLGDIITIEKLLNIKGHNGKSPCRSCNIKSVNNPDSHDKTYYPPLTHPAAELPATPETLQEAYDPFNLPLHKHTDWANITSQLESAQLVKQHDAIAMEALWSMVSKVCLPFVALDQSISNP